MCNVASKKLPVSNFESIKDTSKFNKDFVESYNEESDERYFLEFDIKYLENLHDFHNVLPFLPDTYTHKKLKQALNHGLVFKNVYKGIKFIKMLG